MPLVSWSTEACFCCIITGRFSLGAGTSMPRPAKSLDAISNSSEAWSSALDGMQPTLRQVPPSVGPLSTQATFRPSWPARMAPL